MRLIRMVSDAVQYVRRSHAASVLVLVLLTAAIPLTMFVLNQQTNLQQHADTTPLCVSQRHGDCVDLDDAGTYDGGQAHDPTHPQYVRPTTDKAALDADCTNNGEGNTPGYPPLIEYQCWVPSEYKDGVPPPGSGPNNGNSTDTCTTQSTASREFICVKNNTCNAEPDANGLPLIPAASGTCTSLDTYCCTSSCGNGVCDNGETHSTCPADCKGGGGQCRANGNPYTECESGTPDGCNPDGSKTGHLELVQPEIDCTTAYQCTDEGPCNQSKVTGYFDAADCSNGLQGWACDQGNGASSLTVNFYTDSALTNLVGSTSATLPRADVAAAGDCQSTPNHGFAFQIPNALRTGTAQTVYAAAIDSSGNKVALNTSPKSVTCAAAPPVTTYTCTNNACVAVTDASGQYKDQASCQAACTPAAPQHTYLNLALQLMGIGNNGNLSPQHRTRPLHVQVYRAGDDPTQPNVCPLIDITSSSDVSTPCHNVTVVNPASTVTYDANTGDFLNATYDLGTSLPAGSYQILIKTPGYLRKAVVDSQGNKTFALTPGQTTVLPAASLIVGDVVAPYNVIDIQDYYAIVNCFGSSGTTPSSTCTAGAQITDLNDDGVVDGVDLNWWETGIQQLQQSNDTTGVGDGVPGE